MALAEMSRSSRSQRRRTRQATATPARQCLAPQAVALQGNDECVHQKEYRYG